MKPNNPLPIILFALAFAAPFASAHNHFAAGIVDTNQNNEPDPGEPLQFIGFNGTDLTFHLLPRPVGQRCGGLYMLDELPRTLFPDDAFSLTVQSDGQFEAKGSHHAHTGSWICVEVVSVTGPSGATLGFWEANASVVTEAFATNQATDMVRFPISEGFDEINQDPQGHIHGRAWTADKPGNYQVGIRLVDLSTTGPDGGPWHPPSQIYIYHFSAGPDFQPSLQRNPDSTATLTWQSQMGIWEPYQTGITFHIQRTENLTANNWSTIGSVTGTTADTIRFTDPSPPSNKVFYRLAFDWSNP